MCDVRLDRLPGCNDPVLLHYNGSGMSRCWTLDSVLADDGGLQVLIQLLGSHLSQNLRGPRYQPCLPPDCGSLVSVLLTQHVGSESFSPLQTKVQSTNRTGPAEYMWNYRVINTEPVTRTEVLFILGQALSINET